MAIIATDITYIPNQDIYIDPVLGDFTITDSDYTHISDILYSNTGDWRQFPLVGVNINSYILSPNNSPLLSVQIKNQLVADGYQVTYLNVEDINNIQIQCTRIS